MHPKDITPCPKTHITVHYSWTLRAIAIRPGKSEATDGHFSECLCWVVIRLCTVSILKYFKIPHKIKCRHCTFVQYFIWNINLISLIHYFERRIFTQDKDQCEKLFPLLTNRWNGILVGETYEKPEKIFSCVGKISNQFPNCCNKCVEMKKCVTHFFKARETFTIFWSEVLLNFIHLWQSLQNETQT